MKLRDLNNIYTPHQPDYENKYRIQSYVVKDNDTLYGKISEIYQFKTDEIDDTITIFPDGCFELMFIFYNDHIESHLVSAQSTVLFIKVKESLCISAFSIRFVPGWIGNAKNPHFNKILNTRNSIKYFNSFVIFEDFNRFYREIISSNTFERRIEVCRHYFEKMKPADTQSDLARQGCLYLIQNNGNSTILELEKFLGYSLRYIRKIFSEYVGFSPKTLNEIIRFQYSFGHYYSNPRMSLSDLAYEFGYYDLSHMNRSYIKIANHLPKELYQKVSPCAG
jgi:AraC-type DNA-binding domain-containing proteins